MNKATAMREMLTLTEAWLAGAVLGAIFFGGLWWTVRKCASSRRPALWFAASLLLRMAIALGGFYFVFDGDWKRLIACLAGFVMARLLVTWLTRPSPALQTRPAQGAGDAP
jgi:F1F0 ATPase subunit 2